MSFIISVVGVVLIFEGMPWFLSPGRTKIFMARIQILSNTKLRFFGLAAMLCGLILVRLSN